MSTRNALTTMTASAMTGRHRCAVVEPPYISPPREAHAVNRQHILVANAPRSYREAIAGAIRHLRPDLTISEVEPDEIAPAMRDLDPGVVILSQDPPVSEHDRALWIVLYGDEAPDAVVRSNGRIYAVANVELDALLSLVDRCVALIRLDEIELPN